MPNRTVKQTTMFYEEAGSGPPLVLLHGFPLDSGIWARQRAELGVRFRVITPDLRGFGQSKSNEAFSLADLAEDVHALLLDLKALPCVFGGLSMGGYVSLEFASKYAKDLLGFVLIDTRAEADTPEGKQGREKMIQLAKEKGSTAVADAMMPKMVAPQAEHKRPGMVKELRRIMENCPAETIQHALAAMRDRRDHVATLPTIKVPSLVIVGESDAITPVALAESMQKKLPNSQLVIIRGAGHMSPMEQPEQVNSAILRFADRSF